MKMLGNDKKIQFPEGSLIPVDVVPEGDGSNIAWPVPPGYTLVCNFLNHFHEPQEAEYWECENVADIVKFIGYLKEGNGFIKWYRIHQLNLSAIMNVHKLINESVKIASRGIYWAKKEGGIVPVCATKAHVIDDLTGYEADDESDKDSIRKPKLKKLSQSSAMPR